MIKIGTSGFSFQDWIGTVYPPGIKKGDMLSYYEKHLGFKITEINATYYTIPSPKSFAGMIKKTSSDFDFTVKAHKSLTHEIRENNTGKFIDNKEAFERFLYSIGPLQKEGRLLAVLAQFPYSFHTTEENYNYIRTFQERLKNLPLVVEFRNGNWHNQKSIAFLKDNHIGYCAVDEPKYKNLMPYNPMVTTDLGYFRFHGRNPRWFQASAAERYDYLYSKEELQSFLPDIENIARSVSKTIVMFNNCHAGKSVINAKQLIDMLRENS
ncbi:MAG: DUF72 domain-containing protein [Candidatus Brocadiaceae baterium WH-1]|nr:MAG: DUF72 domain-containing protein [Candidatus Jettenia sp. AMX2]